MRCCADAVRALHCGERRAEDAGGAHGGGFTSFRLRMAGGYGAAAIAKHARAVKALLAAGRDVYVYYKHEDEPNGPLAAEALLQALRPKRRGRS